MTNLEIINFTLNAKTNFIVDQKEKEMVYSVYFTDHQGNELRDKSFRTQEDADKYVTRTNNLFNNESRVIKEEKFW
tara:strand:+ start:279 stop:506 length:228 start_codon:yes stop_codon:yes gene_type:complete